MIGTTEIIIILIIVLLLFGGKKIPEKYPNSCAAWEKESSPSRMA